MFRVIFPKAGATITVRANSKAAAYNAALAKLRADRGEPGYNEFPTYEKIEPKVGASA